MKLLLFAHVPPPLHGQSYMVEVMLRGFGGDQRGRKARLENNARPEHSIACYHVNAQLSDDLDAVGAYRLRKLFRLARSCLEAIWCRFRYRIDTFYYIPAPPKRIALFRDWIVLALCRPFFPRTVLHWHACGLAEWLRSQSLPWERWITLGLLRRANLAIALSTATAADAAQFQARQLEVVANGIRDPCPDFANAVLPKRRTRSESFRAAMKGASARGSPASYEVLFLGACLREKGLFDTIEAVQYSNRKLEKRGIPLRLRLTVAGSFITRQEQAEFESARRETPEMIEYVGFASPEMKERLWRTSDCLCFPTYYRAEAQPVVLIEAMAFGLTVVTTKWRAIPEMLPAETVTAEICDPPSIGEALLRSIGEDQAERLRANYLDRFGEGEHLKNLARAILSLDSAAS